MAPNIVDGIYLKNGKIVIYPRKKVYQARIYVGPNQYVWKSLRTTSEEEARERGYETYADLLNKKNNGTPIRPSKFSTIIDGYIAHRENEHAQGRTKKGMLYQIKRVTKFLNEYAGSKSLHEIDDEVLTGYEAWRRDYYTNYYVKRDKRLPRNAKLYPTDKTIQFDLMVAKSILKWADAKKLRGSQPPPITFKYKPKHKRARPAFELSDYRRLWRVLWNRVRAAKNNRERASRELLRDYVLILANSGLRVGELNSLKMRDIQQITDTKGRLNFQLHVNGKTGERKVIPRASAVKFFRRIMERRKDAKPDGYLFVMPDGSKITTLIDQFNAALIEAGLTHASNGEKFSLYSLRHFYAVTALRRGTEVFPLARNMGTSVRMIENYYGRQATTPQFTETLGN